MTQETQEIQQTVAAVLDGQTQDPPASPPAAPPAPNGPKPAAKKRKAKKKIKRIIALVVVLALLAGAGWAIWYFIFRETVEQGELLTDEARIDTIQSKVAGSGNARAGENAAITLNSSGTVQDVYVEVGDTVFEGDPLYSIYSPAAQKAVQDAEDAVEAAQYAIPDAQYALEQAQETLADAQQALAQAPQDNQEKVADAQNAVKDAEDGVKDAQDNLAQVQKDLAELQASAGEASIAAPYSGRLISVEEIAVGDELGAGSAVATIANDSIMKLTLNFSYAYEHSVYVGQSVNVSVPSMMLSCTGTVSAVNMIRKIAPEGAILFEAEVSVPNPGALTDGLEATASMAAADGSEILPYDAGKLTYGETTKLTAKVGGKVESVDLRVDASVYAGQVLVRQSAEGINDQIAAKQKEVTAAQKGVETAQKGVETARKGVEAAQKDGERELRNAQRNVREQQRAVEQAARNVETAQNAVPEAEAELEKARQDLEDLNAVAPISGTVTSCTLTPGQEVKGGDTVITIADTTNMVVEIQVNDQNIGFVVPGMTVELSDYNDNVWMGVVTKIDTNPSQDNMGSGVTNYPVTLTVDNFDGSLTTGMWLQYSFVASQAEDCLIVPNQAVKSTMDEEGNDITVVFIQAESRPDNAVTMPEQSPDMPKKYPTEDEGFYAVPVTTGLNDTYNVEIRSGLNPGDIVFTNYLSASGDSWGMYG